MVANVVKSKYQDPKHDSVRPGLKKNEAPQNGPELSKKKSTNEEIKKKNEEIR